MGVYRNYASPKPYTKIQTLKKSNFGPQTRSVSVGLMSEWADYVEVDKVSVYGPWSGREGDLVDVETRP